MPGRWINNQQVEVYMNSRNSGHSQETSAAKAGISERSGREIEREKRADPKLQKRAWRTRVDPLAKIWDLELEPMLRQSPTLQPITLLEYLQAKYPDNYSDSILRTLQRRIKSWRALSGPDKPVMFLQNHEAGRLGLSDFTKLKRATITIAGVAFKHLLYHFRLAFSHWSSMKVIEGGESFEALSAGLQEGLRQLGGAPLEHRTDSLSAAYKNLNKEAEKDFTTRYESLCKDYAMKASRNNRGAGHENGSVESPHGHLKRRIEQALILRGSSDFASVSKYQDFINEVVQQHNRRNAKAIDIERPLLQALPTYNSIDYEEVLVTVSCTSTIDIRRVTYTVPSRLQGETLNIRLYNQRLECYLGCQHVTTLNRIYPASKSQRARQVDYRHLIHSLVRKPQAFRYSRLRDDLLPNDTYKSIWQHIDQHMQPKQACKFIVGLLHLAATENCEAKLGKIVLEKLKRNKPLSLSDLQDKFRRVNDTRPTEIAIHQHSLPQYNQLIPTLERCHA